MRKVVLEEGPEVRGTSFVMRGKTEVGFGASLGGRAGEVGSGVKAAFSMESKAVKSAFVRTGVMRISSGAVEGFWTGLIRIVCSCM